MSVSRLGWPVQNRPGHQGSEQSSLAGSGMKAMMVNGKGDLENLERRANLEVDLERPVDLEVRLERPVSLGVGLERQVDLEWPWRPGCGCWRACRRARARSDLGLDDK